MTDPTDVSGRYSAVRKKADRENNSVIPLPFCPKSALPPFIEHDRRLLVFNAYFEEDVYESALESKRIHMCGICFYVEDGTLEIIKTKQENSGMPHGVFLRRGRVLKNKSVSSYYDIDDFKVGNVVEIYGRHFHIVGCNESTKHYVVKRHGWTEEHAASVPFPEDRFSERSRERMRRESGVPGVNRNRKMHELKEIMETVLGKQTSMTDRGMFLECGQSALCFHIVWDDRSRLYGDIQFFKLMYYLADNTVEIIPLHHKGEGKNTFPKLLKKCKLPKSSEYSVSGEGNDFYTWRDIAIGSTINVFNRTMIVGRCDAFTRDFYESKGITLEPDMSLKSEEEKVEINRQIPPYNGFGSEEDSLRSCTGGINPPPHKKDISNMRDKLGIVLRFNANLVTGNSEDTKRRFVIQYFMEDGTISIREPPVKNSGIVGGNFLKRQDIKKPDGSRYTAADMYIGHEVEFVCHRFVLLNADENTYRTMECGDVNFFPYSDFSRLHAVLSEQLEDIKKYFVADYRGDGTIGMDEFTACCKSVGMKLNKQEVVTLWRKVDKKGKGRVSFTKLIKLASEKAIYIWK